MRELAKISREKIAQAKRRGKGGEEKESNKSNQTQVKLKKTVPREVKN